MRYTNQPGTLPKLQRELETLRAELEQEKARAEQAEAKAAVIGGEWCAQNQAEGRGPCGACARCCAALRAELERKDAALRTLIERHATVVFAFPPKDSRRDAVRADCAEARAALAPAAPSAPQGMDAARLHFADRVGRIEPSSIHSPVSIAVARAQGRFFVDPDGLGFVFIPAPAAPSASERKHERTCPLYEDDDWNSTTRANYERSYGEAPKCTCKPEDQLNKAETRVAELEKLLQLQLNIDEWDDKDDEYTERIHEAFPTRSGSHENYATAMQMVGNRHSKGALVALVNWLLNRIDTANEDCRMMQERLTRVVEGSSKPDIVKLNAQKDPNYKPYCMRCSGLQRMSIVEPMYWRCSVCGAEHDVRESASPKCSHENQDVNDRSQAVCRDCGEELGR